MPITASVLSVAGAHPSRPAIVGEDGALSYAELVSDSGRVFAVVSQLLSSQLHSPQPAPETQGIPVTAVSVTSAFHAARIVAGLAGFRAVSATIDPQWPLAHRLRVITKTGIGLVVSDDERLAEALATSNWGGTVISLAEFLSLEVSIAPGPAPEMRDGAEPFLLLFSSGTTSDPKAFLKTRQQYRDNVAVSSAHLGPRPGIATFAPGPLSYSLTLYALIECLATGGSAHLASSFDPIEMAARIPAEGITRVVAVPAVVQALSDGAARDPSRFERLSLVVTGGANLPQPLRDGLARALPGVELISYYGAAEIGFIGDSRGGDGTLLDVYDGISVSIRDAHGAELPEGEYGTLWVHANACSDGYIAGTTEEVLRGPDGWASVGDQGRLLGGQLQLQGRAGDIAVTGGHKVALTEVERAFLDLTGVPSVCAIALPHPKLGSVVALVQEADPGKQIAREALQAFAREQLAPQFVPRQWYRLDRLPRTVGGKIRRDEVVGLVRAGKAERL